MDALLKHMPELLLTSLGGAGFYWVKRADRRLDKLEEKEAGLAVQLADLNAKMDILIKFHQKDK